MWQRAQPMRTPIGEIAAHPLLDRRLPQIMNQMLLVIIATVKVGFAIGHLSEVDLRHDQAHKRAALATLAVVGGECRQVGASAPAARGRGTRRGLGYGLLIGDRHSRLPGRLAIP